MAYIEPDLMDKSILCIKPEYEGPTYYLDGEPTCLAICKADGSQGHYCSKPAGTGTDHPKTGRCLNHGGRNGSAPIKTGRYSPVLGKRMHALYASYANDPDLLDLTPELMLLRALLGRMLEYNQDMDLAAPENVHERNSILRLIEQVSKQVERIERIDANHVLTVATAKLIMAKAMGVGTKYVAPDMIDAFLEEWQQDVMQPISLATYQVKE